MPKAPPHPSNQHNNNSFTKIQTPMTNDKHPFFFTIPYQYTSFIKFDLFRTRLIAVTMLGEKLKQLREAKGMVQRQVAAVLEVDTAYISKMESNEKPVSRQHLKKLSVLLGIAEEDLLTLWLADKLYDLAKGEAVGLKAMEVAEAELKMHKRKDSEKN